MYRVFEYMYHIWFRVVAYREKVLMDTVQNMGFHLSRGFFYLLDYISLSRISKCGNQKKK